MLVLMTRYSTNEAAAKLGITGAALSRYIKSGKVPPPQIIKTGKASLHVWSDEDIERVRKLLPKIANGRKTRWQREREAEKEKLKQKKRQPRAAQPQHAKTARAGGPKAALPRVKRKKK
jgi:predicted transcriptional regulator